MGIQMYGTETGGCKKKNQMKKQNHLPFYDISLMFHRQMNLMNFWLFFYLVPLRSTANKEK